MYLGTVTSICTYTPSVYSRASAIKQQLGIPYTVPNYMQYIATRLQGILYPADCSDEAVFKNRNRKCSIFLKNQEKNIV